jgi:SAM-dependent methyltransferase
MFRIFRRRARKQAMDDGSGHRGFLNLGGRRYVAGAPYLLPKDLQEIDRLDFQHFMLRYLLRGNFVAPVRQPLSILDVGSGTNRWGIEMALQFPSANVVGVDLMPSPTPTIQPPENYVFTQGNVVDGLPFGDDAFDFVHQRLLILALPTADWQKAISELVRVARPGGWIELVESTGQVEFNGPRRSAGSLLRLNDWSVRACSMREIDLALGGRIGTVLQSQGLRNVSQRQIPIPLGSYGGRIGVMMETNYFSALGALKNLITAMKITTPEEYDAAVAAARGEIAQNTCIFPYYVAYGQVGSKAHHG